MKNNATGLFFLSIVLSFFCLIPPSPALAGEPTVQVKQTVDAVLDVLRNKELKRPEKAEQRRAQIRKVVSGRFDFAEMAKRSLAQHWKKRTPEEQKEFVPLYTDLLESTYVRKIEQYENEKVAYLDEKVEGDHAAVKTNIVTIKGVEIPIEYRLLKEGDQWKAYDVVIEGVSLVNNYRNQFNNVIRSGSYEELIKRLKNKALKEPT